MSFPRLFQLLHRCLLAGLLGTVAAAGAADIPRAKGGTLDLSGWDFGRDGIAALDGDWEFFPGAFVAPGQDATAAGRLQKVPEPWNDALGSGKGFATYRLRVICPAPGATDLALSLPFEHSALTLYVNGKVLARQGQPGAALPQHQPALASQIVALGSVHCPLELVAQVANHEVFRGGLVRSVQLGTHRQLLAQREGALTRSLLALGSVLIVGLLSLIFYFWRRQDRTPLYFGLYAIAFAVSLGLSGERPLQLYMQNFSFDTQLSLLFVNWYFGLSMFPLFLRTLYPRYVGRVPVRAIGAFSAAGVVLTIVTPVQVFGMTTPLLQAGAAAVALYLTYALLRALRDRQRGAGTLLVGLAILVATSAHDIVFFQHVLSISLAPYGVIGFVLAPAILLARRFARALAMEERLAIEQRERADLLVRSTKAGVLDWDAIGGRVSYSDRYREILGYRVGPDAPEPPPFRELLHPEDEERVHGSFLRQLRDRATRSGVRVNEPMEYRLRRADGEYVWIHAEAVSVCDSAGRTLRFICSFIDISDSKHHEIEMFNRVKFTNDLFDSIPLGLTLRDPDGRYLFVNRTWERYIGLPRESVIGSSLQGVKDAAAESALALDREALALGPDAPIAPHEHDYNGRRYLQTRTVMVDAEGRHIGVLAASLDITEKYATEHALDLERERLRLLVRSTKAGFGDWDAVRDTVSYTDRFKEMLGYPADTDTSAWPSIFEMMHGDDRDRAREQFREMIRRKREPGEQEPGLPMSYRLRRRDGSHVWIHAEGISQVDGEGRTRRFITSYLDVNAFHEQEEALRRSRDQIATEQKRLDLVVRGARVGIVDWDGHSHETYYSPRFREIRGYAPDADTSAWPDYFRVMIHPDDRERVIRRWVPFIRGKGPEGPHGEYYSPEEYRLLRADGSYAGVQVSGMAVRDERGFVIRWIAAVIDITERRAHEQALSASHDQIAAQAAQLELQNEALKENARLREEVERIGRHDIKTPLNSIVAVPRLLREERRLGPEADELLGIVERAGYRILSMVNLSLDLYKMEQGSYVFRPDAVDLADLVNKVAVDVRMHAASKQVLLKLDVALAPYLWAEELLCYSLLANLLKNAVEASPEGGVVSISAGSGPGETVLLRIHNMGVVPESIRGHFFEKYATLGKASGTGLGTYSARLMARMQDGDIAMETSDTAGTTITIRLRAAAAGTVPATVRHAAERHGSDPLLVAAMPPMRVLLVDDDEYNLLIVRRFLPSPPFTVDTAINGRVALGAAELQWPDIIFMDLDMPVMGGLQAVQELRAMERATLAKRCTIVALSSHEDDETRQLSLAAGFDRYLTKPVTRDVIHETLLELNMLIADQGAAAPVAQSPPRAEPAAPGTADAVLLDPDIEPVLGEFMESRRDLIDAMQQAMQQGDRSEVRRIAHQLAGSFGLYGFHWASSQSRAIEKDFSQIDRRDLARMAGELSAHLDSVEIRFEVL
ncbi:MAG: PAS domain-containing protein [Ramlibacter sp.]